MGRKKEAVVLIFVLLVMLVLSFFSLFVWEKFTGYAVIDEAYGGNVTQLNIGTCSKWFGFFGNMTGNNSGDPNSFDVGGCDDVLRQNLGLVRCFMTELYATPATAHLDTSSDAFLPSTDYMNSLSAATVTLFDSFFNFTNISDFTSIKGAAVFNETAEFDVGNGNLTIPSQTLSPRDSNYTMGLLKDEDDNVILVFRIANGTAFNGEQVDFEMMLPAHPGNITYYFFQDRTDEVCVFLGFVISDLQAGRSAVLAEDMTVDVTVVPQQDIKDVLFLKDDEVIVRMTVNFSLGRNASNIIFDVDRTSRKAVVHIGGPTPGLTGFTLLIPREVNSGKVFICPNATTLEDVVPSCPGVVTIETGQTRQGMTLSEDIISGKAYYFVTNITGTGGAEILLSGAGPSPRVSEGGGGGPGVPRPRCGDRLCQNTENCTVCPTDCGQCPIFETPLPAPIQMVFEKEKIVSDDESARELFAYAQELVLGHPECYVLSNLLDQASDTLETKDYVLTILHSRSIIQECEARLATTLPVLLEPAPSLPRVWILLAAVIAIVFFIVIAEKRSKWLRNARKTGKRMKRWWSTGKSRTRKRRR